MVFAHRQQRIDRAEAAGDDADQPTVRVPGQQRETAGELNNADDDQEPSHRAQIREDVPRVVRIEIRVSNRADPIDDVERAHQQQQDRRKDDSTGTSHLGLLPVTGYPIGGRVPGLPLTGQADPNQGPRRNGQDWFAH
jgi:hypothetical protein